MAHCVHIHVCFKCTNNEPIAALAQKHLSSMLSKDDREPKWFLEDLSKRTGTNPGPKGGLSLWGMVGNYTHVDKFVEVLRPFWEELLREYIGDICDHEHILVFEEQEQREKTTAYEIFLDPVNLIVKVHECPFAFMQF